MENKGFTLTELLGVIVILGVLMTIAIPIIDNSLNKSKNHLYDTQVSQIKKGAKDYYAENLDKLPSSGNANVTIQKLQELGYLPLNIQNPKSDKMINPATSSVTVTRTNNKYSYKVDIKDIE